MSENSLSERDQIRLLLLALIAECFTRYLRLPFFPTLIPLILWAIQRARWSSWVTVVYTLLTTTLLTLTAGVTTGWMPISIACIGAFSTAAKRSISRGPLFALTLLIWMVISRWNTGLMVGSFPFELFFAAVLKRILFFDSASLFAARALILGLTFLLSWISPRWIIQSVPAISPGILRWYPTKLTMGTLFVLAMLSAFFYWNDSLRRNSNRFGAKPPGHLALSQEGESSCVGCHAPKSDAPIQILPATFRVTDGHIELPKEQRDNATCLGCHARKLFQENQPLDKIGIHEIHFNRLGFKIDCVFCHEKAGQRGFPEVMSINDRRTTYNKQCVSCHGCDGDEKGTKTLFWERSFR